MVVDAVEKTGTSRAGDTVSIHGNSNNLIKDIQIGEVNPGDADRGVKLRSDGQINGDGDVKTEGVHVGRFTTEEMDGMGGAMRVYGHSHKNLSIGEISLPPSINIDAAVTISGSTVNSLTVDSIQIDEAITNRVFSLVGGTGQALTINHLFVYDASANVVHESGATVGKVNISNISYIGPAGADGSGTGGFLIRLNNNPINAVISDGYLDHIEQLVRGGGGAKSTVKAANLEISNPSRVVDTDADLDLRISNVETNALLKMRYGSGIIVFW